jgi:hypothetical protein
MCGNTMSHSIYVDPRSPMTVAASLAEIDLAGAQDSRVTVQQDSRVTDPSPAAVAVLTRLHQAAGRLGTAAVTLKHLGGDDRTRRLEQQAGIVAMLLSELVKLKVIDLLDIRQYGRDHAELLAARPELIAPHVVVVDPDACEHEHWTESVPSACPSCKLEFVSCGPCDEVHAAPECEA